MVILPDLYSPFHFPVGFGATYGGGGSGARGVGISAWPVGKKGHGQIGKHWVKEEGESKVFL